MCYTEVMKNCLLKLKIYKNGFTLAEVLITLVIIGVVAALTIPNLINKTNREELRTGLLKAQTVLSGSLEKFYAKNGYRLTPNEVYSGGNSYRLYKMIKPYFSIAKDCGASNCVDCCSSSVYKTYSGSNAGSGVQQYLDDGQFVLNDGMTIFIENQAGSSNVYLAVDTNGYEKKPNKAGYDLFFFQMNNDGYLIPMGAEGTNFSMSQYCKKTSSDARNGMGCTAKALNDANYFKNLP